MAAESPVVLLRNEEEIVNNTKKNAEVCDLKEYFWKLPDWNSSCRVNAVLGLISSIKDKNNDPKQAISVLNYTIKRLVRGLSSTNKAARLGFFVALVETLRVSLDQHSSENVIDVITREYSETQGNQDVSNLAVGACLAYGAVIRSGTINEEPEKIIRVFEELMRISLQKDYLQEMCAAFATDLFSKVDKSLFKNHVWPKIKKHFEIGWETCTSEQLWMMIVLTRSQSGAVQKKFLSKHWGVKQLLGDDVHGAIARILVKSTKGVFKCHPVCKVVVRELISTGSFAKFWKSFVQDLEVTQTKEKLYLVYELLKEALCHVDNRAKVDALLLPSVMSSFMKTLANSEFALHDSALNLADAFINKIATMDCGELQFELLRHLLQKPGSVLFDRVTCTRTIASIIPTLKPDAKVWLIDLLKRTFTGNSINCSVEPHSESQTAREAALVNLTVLVGTDTGRDLEMQTDVLQFLLLNAFFNQTASSTDIPQCAVSSVGVTQNLHSVSKDCFYKSLCGLTQRVSLSQKSSGLHHMCELYYSLLNYLQRLLHKPEVASPLVQWNKETQQMFDGAFIVASKIHKKSQLAGKHDPKDDAFLSLYFLFSLRLLTDQKQVTELIQELNACYGNTATDDAESEEPEWSSMIVQLLLSLLFENDQSVRKIANGVFSLIVPHMTMAALDCILDVINPRGNSGSPHADSDDGEDASGESDASDVESEDEDVSEALKSSVKAALGDAAAKSDEEDEIYMDDEAMMRLDDTLSEVFSTMAKRKSSLSKDEVATQHFCIRCLDFLNTVVNFRPSISFLMHMVRPVVSALIVGLKEKNQTAFVWRCKTSLRLIISVKKFHQEDVQSDVNFVEVLSDLLEDFKLVMDSAVTQLLSETCIFVVKCATHYDQIASRTVSDMPKSDPCKDLKMLPSVSNCLELFKQSLETFFGNGDFRVPFQLFAMLIHKYLSYGWQLSDILLKYAFSDDVRLFKKCQAMSMMSDLVSYEKHIQQSVEVEKWRNFSLTGFRGIRQALTKMAPSVKPNYLKEIVRFGTHVINISKRMDIPIEERDEACESLRSLSENKELSKAVIKTITKMLELLGNPCPRPQKRKANPDSKRQAKKAKLKKAKT